MSRETRSLSAHPNCRKPGQQGGDVVLSTSERVGVLNCSGSRLLAETSRGSREVGLCSWSRSRKEERHGIEVDRLGSDEEHRVHGHRRRGLSTGTGFEEEEAETR
jgi:hypothetical protein